MGRYDKCGVCGVPPRSIIVHLEGVHDALALQAGLTDVGEGPVVLMLHGNPDNRSGWNAVIEGVGPRVRVLAPDLPGFGGSPEPPAEYDFSLETQSQFVDAVLRRAGVDPLAPICLVVHDIGAVAGLSWAANNPQRLRGVVICNTVVHPDYRWHTMARIWRTPIVGRSFLAMMTRWAFKRSFQPAELTDAQLDAMWAGIDGATKSTICRLYRVMTRPEFFVEFPRRVGEALAGVRSSVLWGDNDPYIDASYANRFGCRRVVHLPDCGHWLPQQRPDAVVAAIEQCIARATSGQTCAVS